ncbi:conserved hypothetical protein [Oenococcus oeni]|nr:conserved hypothetical protein [Oenococcus oeni]
MLSPPDPYTAARRIPLIDPILENKNLLFGKTLTKQAIAISIITVAI